MAPAELRSRPRHRLAKRVSNLLAALLVSPLVLGYRASATLFPGRRTALFQGYSQLLSLLPGTSGNHLRRAFYRRTLARCSDTCTISFATILSTPEAEIGEHVYIGARCMIGLATLEDDVLIGSNVDLLSGRNQHRFDTLDLPIRLQGGDFQRVTIGRDSWIGNGACIAADVGAQAVVGLGSVVVRPVPARTIVGGNPARALAERTGSAGATPSLVGLDTRDPASSH